MRACVVIFAKAPVQGQVKTRLAARIGAVTATAAYRRMLAKTVAELRGDRRWRLVLAVTPDSAVARGPWPERVPRIGQGRGDLGTRMARAVQHFAPAPVVIVGSDIPDLTRADIVSALRALAGAEVVLGPATDGGYWLIGFRNARLAGRLKAPIRWSSAHALADTRGALGAAARVAFLRELSDVDTAESYQEWQGFNGACALRAGA